MVLLCNNRSYLRRKLHLQRDDPNKSTAPAIYHVQRRRENSSEIRRWPLNYYGVPLQLGSSTSINELAPRSTSHV
jgi:hypothetical protein